MNYFRRKTDFFLLSLFIIFILLSACSPKETKNKELETVKVQLGWIHHSQWAGFYAAEKNGYYSEEGIDIELIPRSTPTVNVFDIVENNEADFGTTNALNLITEKSKNRKIKAIAAIYQRDPGVFMSLEESGIIKLEDFPGKRIKQLEPLGNGMVLRAMMNKVGLSIDSMIQIETGFDLSKFFNGEVDIWYGFLTNEVQVARSAGYAVNVIHPNGYGVNIYGTAIFATDSFLNDNPDLVLGFLRATIKGWQWAIGHPIEASGLVMEYNPDLDEKQELRNFESSIPLIYTAETYIGAMKEEIWQETIDLLMEQNLLENNINAEDVYTTQFIDELLRGKL